MLKSLSPKDSFKVCLLLLETVGSLVTDDYYISDKCTNHAFLGSHLSKNKIKEFRGTIRRNVKFLKKCIKDKDTDLKKLVKLKQQLSDWHKYLTQQHMYIYMQNRSYGWNYLGLCMHYLLDAYYHIYARLVSDVPACSWCNKDLNHNWEEVISQIMIHHLPTIYLYLSLSQIIYLDEPITEEAVDSHMKNMKFLLRDAIKVGILKHESLAQTQAK